MCLGVRGSRAERKTLAEALEVNSRTRKSLIDDIVGSGVATDDVTNAGFSSSPQYGWFGRKPTQYEVVNRLKVTIDDESQLSFLAGLADQSEDVAVGSIEFEHSAKEELEQQVREAALDDAIRQSHAYAEKLGLELKPVSFSFAPFAPQQPRSSAVIEEIVVTAQRQEHGIGPAAAGFAPKQTFDEIEYQARVEVTFEASPADDDGRWR